MGQRTLKKSVRFETEKVSWIEKRARELGFANFSKCLNDIIEKMMSREGGANPKIVLMEEERTLKIMETEHTTTELKFQMERDRKLTLIARLQKEVLERDREKEEISKTKSLQEQTSKQWDLQIRAWRGDILANPGIMSLIDDSRPFAQAGRPGWDMVHEIGIPMDVFHQIQTEIRAELQISKASTNSPHLSAPHGELLKVRPH